MLYRGCTLTTLQELFHVFLVELFAIHNNTCGPLIFPFILFHPLNQKTEVSRKMTKTDFKPELSVAHV
jgi:hypothetical protein